MLLTFVTKLFHGPGSTSRWSYEAEKPIRSINFVALRNIRWRLFHVNFTSMPRAGGAFFFFFLGAFFLPAGGFAIREPARECLCENYHELKKKFGAAAGVERTERSSLRIVNNSAAPTPPALPQAAMSDEWEQMMPNTAIGKKKDVKRRGEPEVMLSRSSLVALIRSGRAARSDLGVHNSRDRKATKHHPQGAVRIDHSHWLSVLWGMVAHLRTDKTVARCPGCPANGFICGEELILSTGEKGAQRLVTANAIDSEETHWFMGDGNGGGTTNVEGLCHHCNCVDGKWQDKHRDRRRGPQTWTFCPHLPAAGGSATDRRRS